MRREIGVPALNDVLLPDRMGRNEHLERLNSVIDWDRVDALLAEVHSSPEGSLSYPSLLMAKVMLLQQWHDLSDPEMEDMLDDRISFRRFAGLGLADTSPDHSMIGRFRAELTRLGLMQSLLDEVSRQLDEHGVALKKGTIVDATLA